MEPVRIATSQNVGLHYEAAGLGDRSLAALIDAVLVWSYVLMTWMLLTLVPSSALHTLLYLPAFAYHLVCEVVFDGRSLGKWVRDLQVIRTDGTSPSLGSYLVRWLLRLVEVEATFGVVATVAALVNGRGQRVGDLAAGTAVVRTARRTQLADTLLADPAPDYTPTFSAAEHLTDAEATLARSVYDALRDQGRTATAAAVGRQLQDTLAARLDLQTDLPPDRFLRTLLHDYNHLHGRR